MLSHASRGASSASDDGGSSAIAVRQPQSPHLPALTEPKPPAPYAEDAAEEDELHRQQQQQQQQQGRSHGDGVEGLEQRGREHDEHVATVAAAAETAAASAAASNSEHDEEEARALETQLRLVKGHRDAMNAVMQLAQAAKAAGHHQQPPLPNARSQAGAASSDDGGRSSSSSSSKRKRTTLQQGGPASSGKAPKAAVEAPSPQWSPWAAAGSHENFVKLFGHVPGLQGPHSTDAGDADAGKGTDGGHGQESQQQQQQQQAQAEGNNDVTSYQSPDKDDNVAHLDTAQDPETAAAQGYVSDSQDLMQQHQQQQQGDADETLAPNARNLNPSKRAAQNRAAQRAFRARREEYVGICRMRWMREYEDKMYEMLTNLSSLCFFWPCCRHVRMVELKAKQTDEAVRTAEHYRQRYEDALETVEALRADNETLRLAISAMGGRAPPPPARSAATAGAESRTEPLPRPDIDGPTSAREYVEEGAQQSGDSRNDDGEEARGSREEESREDPAAAGQDTRDREEEPSVNAGRDADAQLGGLSAVAAAAAAAAALGRDEPNLGDDGEAGGRQLTAEEQPPQGQQEKTQ